MARARNIKPSFFINEELVELPFSTRLLFIGLWTVADREGRLEDKPKKIKMAIFPADDVDVNAALDDLHKAGLILRYEHGADKFIQIASFTKHQNPHRDEKASLIPAPVEHDASTVQAPCKEDANTVAIGLNPESFNLNPDSCLIDKPQAASAKAPKFDFAKALSERGADEKAIAAWLIVRKSKKASNTEIALDGFVRSASESGLSVADAVLLCAERSWAGLNPEWLKPKSQASPNGYESVKDRERRAVIESITGVKNDSSPSFIDIN